MRTFVLGPSDSSVIVARLVPSAWITRSVLEDTRAEALDNPLAVSDSSASDSNAAMDLDMSISPISGETT